MNTSTIASSTLFLPGHDQQVIVVCLHLPCQQNDQDTLNSV